MSAVTESPEHKLTLEKLYVWELPVRLTHWLLFFSILVLSATGYYIGHPFISVPGAAKDHFVMGTARAVHMYAAIVFVLAMLVRFYWLFAGNRFARLTDLIPMSLDRLHSFWKTFKYYSFISRSPDEYAGHNALAGSTYAMIFVVYVVMTVTGLILYAVNAPIGSPLRMFEALAPLFGELPIARLIHHVGMWVILIFAVLHIYFVLLSSVIEHIGTFDSIFSGYKFLPERKTGHL
jgi:Ni/Fe-hydrogenase 1 B-type cytochrome subunit